MKPTLIIAITAPLTQKRLGEVCREHFTILGEVGDSPSLVRELLKAKPTVVLFDTHLAGGDVLKVVREMKGQKQNPVWVAITGSSDGQLPLELWESGVTDIFQKPCETAEQQKKLLHTLLAVVPQELVPA